MKPGSIGQIPVKALGLAHCWGNKHKKEREDRKYGNQTDSDYGG